MNAAKQSADALVEEVLPAAALDQQAPPRTKAIARFVHHSCLPLVVHTETQNPDLMQPMNRS